MNYETHEINCKNVIFRSYVFHTYDFSHKNSHNDFHANFILHGKRTYYIVYCTVHNTIQTISKECMIIDLIPHTCACLPMGWCDCPPSMMKGKVLVGCCCCTHSRQQRQTHLDCHTVMQTLIATVEVTMLCSAQESYFAKQVVLSRTK